MPSHYQLGQYSKLHLEEVEEICDLRHLYDMPCKGCHYKDQEDCPEVRERDEAVMPAEGIVPI